MQSICLFMVGETTRGGRGDKDGEDSVISDS